MRPRSPGSSRLRRARALLAISAATTLVSCGGASLSSVGPAATEEEWAALATPRAAPLPGALRLSLGELDFAASPEWVVTSPLPWELGITELVSAGLLRRPDVQFVERRRFASATDRERRGLPRGGAPEAGTSPDPELMLSVVWVSVAPNPGSLEMRLIEPGTGRIVDTWRTPTPAAPGPVSLARAIVGGLTDHLAGLGRLPPWNDAAADRSTAVPPLAVERFLRGLADEERWDWEGARIGYQGALAADPDFVEAAAALARTARLRMGGTLGAS